MLQKFKDIVDATHLSLKNGTLQYVDEVLGEKTNYDNIQAALYSNTDLELIAYPKFFEIYSELIYRHVLYGDKVETYLQLLDFIHDAGRKHRQKVPTFENTDVWEVVILNAISFHRKYPNGFMAHSSVRGYNAKAYDKAASAKKLIDLGCKIEIVNQDFLISEGLENVIEDIERSIKKLGGLTVIGYLFYLIDQNKRYQPDLQRYLLIRNASMLTTDQEPSVPFGFILNLAAKHCSQEQFSQKESDKEWTNIIDKSMLLATAVYDVQPYSFWESYFQITNIVPFIQKLAMYDSIYSIVQEHPDMAIDSIEGIMDHLNHINILEITQLSPKEIVEIFRALRRITQHSRGAHAIRLDRLMEELPSIPADKVSEFLKRMSISKDEVNVGYNLPASYNEINFMFYPLISYGDGWYVLVDSSWKAPSCFEALGEWFRHNGYNQFDQEVGIACENYVSNLLNNRNVEHFSGDYEQEEFKGDSDIIIETPEAVILIEAKKKALTRGSKSGKDVDLLINLSNSLLHSQVQAGKVEIILRKHGSIKLKNKAGIIRTIELRNRDILRIALTHQDYGAFQDKIIVEQFLQSFLMYQFNPVSEEKEIVDEFKKLNKKAKELQNQQLILNELDPNYINRPFWNCWFLSLPQLKLLIHNSKDNKTFYDEIKRMKHLTYGVLDFYAEYTWARQMQKLPVLN